MQVLGEHRKVVRGAFDHRCCFSNCLDNTPTNSNSKYHSASHLRSLGHTYIHFFSGTMPYIHNAYPPSYPGHFRELCGMSMGLPEQVGWGLWIGNPHLHHNTATQLLHLTKVLTLHSVAVIQIIKQINCYPFSQSYHLYLSILGMIVIVYFLSWRKRHSSGHWEYPFYWIMFHTTCSGLKAVTFTAQIPLPSYLKHGDPFTGKTTFLYWDGPQIFRWYR